jgi:Protein of unknown function (DUF2934)
MPTRKSPTSAEKKPTTRKAPARKTAPATAAALVDPVVAKHTPTYDEIAILAEQFWNERGRPFGSPEVDWLRAEATLYAA